VGLLFWFWFTHLAEFLNLCAPIKADILLIEGWLPDQALVQASKLFWEDGYTAIITTGPPLQHGYFLSEYKTHAEFSAATLVALGIPRELIISLPCPSAERYRTYTSALAVKQYCEYKGVRPNGINIYTMSCHARRSWFIYRQLFAPANVRIGVLAHQPDNFDLRHWWRTSAGGRIVVGEFIAYGYVRLISWKN